MRSLIVIFLTLSIGACISIPESIQPVTDFKLEKYLGKWYEIARLDHSFERGLEQVTAVYSMRDDGGVKVINSGFSSEKKDWKSAQGKAYFVGNPATAHLKVSFFGPFYGSYIIFELDKNYQYAFVSGPDKSYLWLLSRTPTISDDLKAKFIKKSRQLGFDSEQLIFVKQQ